MKRMKIKAKVRAFLKNLYRGLNGAGSLLLQPRTYLKSLDKAHSLTPEVAKIIYQAEDPIEALLLAGHEMYPDDKRKAVNWAYREYAECLYRNGGTDSIVLEDKEVFRTRFDAMEKEGRFSSEY